MSGMSGMSGMNSSMSGMSGSDSMDGMAMTCSMDMLGNWKTIGACFLTSSWQISSEAQFAGTCIGVFLIVLSIEIVRRFGREWDRYIARSAYKNSQMASSAIRQRAQEEASTSDLAHAIPIDDKERNPTSSGLAPNPKMEENVKKSLHSFFGNSARSNKLLGKPQMQPTTIQQCIRSLLYGIQFAGAYVVMLIAMSFNGYILISIVLGGIVGHFVSTWDVFYMEAIELNTEFDDSQLMGQASTPAYLNAIHKTDKYQGSSGACCN